MGFFPMVFLKSKQSVIFGKDIHSFAGPLEEEPPNEKHITMLDLLISSRQGANVHGRATSSPHEGWALLLTRLSLERCPWFGVPSTVGVASCSCVASVASINPNTHELCVCVFCQALCPSCLQPILVDVSVKAFCAHWARCEFPCVAGIDLAGSTMTLPNSSHLDRCPWFGVPSTVGVASCSCVASVASINPNTHELCVCVFCQALCPSCLQPILVDASVKAFCAHWARCEFPCVAGIDLAGSTMTLPNSSHLDRCPWFGVPSTVGVASCSCVASVASINPNTHELCVCVFCQALCPSCLQPILVDASVKAFCAHWARCEFPCVAGIDLAGSTMTLPNSSHLDRCPWFGVPSTVGVASCSGVASVASINPNTHELCVCVFCQALCPSCLQPILVDVSVKAFCAHWARCEFPCVAGIDLARSTMTLPHQIKLYTTMFRFLALVSCEAILQASPCAGFQLSYWMLLDATGALESSLWTQETYPLVI